MPSRIQAGFNEQSFELGVPIPVGAQAGGVSIDMTGKLQRRYPRTGRQRQSDSGEPPSGCHVELFPQRPQPGDTIRFEADASDPDGDEITYEWYLDGTWQTNMTGPIVEWKNPREGPHTTTVKVSDGKGGTAEDAATFTVETDGKLTVELNIHKGQKFTQGDDFAV